MRLTLARHDAAIATSVVRGLSRSASDVVTLLVIVPLLALVGRAWLATLPPDLRELGAFAGASLVTTLLATALIDRLQFHRTDGVLAPQAQRARDGMGYFVPLLLVGLGIGLSALALVGLGNPGGLVMGVCSGLPSGVLFPFVRERVRQWWRRSAPKRLRSWTRTRHPLAKAAVLSLAVATLSLFIPTEYYLDAIAVGIFALGVTLLTGRVDARVVRFMTLVGHTAPALLRHWLPIQLALLWPPTLVLLAAQAWVPAAVAGFVAVALPVATGLRIFAYRAFGRLIADWTVAIVILAAAYAGFTAPPLGPVIIAAALVWLARAGAGTRWLLA